jgi:hypothetical protein
MVLAIGRQGYVGLAIEATAGTPESAPTIFIPFTDNNLQEKHEPLADISSRASRVKDYDAVAGKKWGEGDLEMYLDATNTGYLLKLGLGNEVKTVVNASPAIHDHQFFVTASGNTPKSATMWVYRGATPSVKQYAYSVVDSLELEVTTDDIATISASFMTGYPSKVSAPTLTTVSGTLLTWQTASVQFGATVNDALAAAATKLTNFKLTIANNVETHYRNGSGTPDVITFGEAEITGDYTLFLEDDVELDKYRDLTKNAMVITVTGASLGGGYTESLKIVIARAYLEDHSPETKLDGMFALTQSFRAIQGTTLNPGYVDITLRNGKTSVY